MKHSYKTWEKMFNKAQARIAKLEDENNKLKLENNQYKREIEKTARLCTGLLQ